MNYKYKKEAKSILIPMTEKKFNLILPNNLTKQIKISSIYCVGLNNNNPYQINVQFLNFPLFTGNLIISQNLNLKQGISFPIGDGNYNISIIDITDNSVPTTGYVVINMIFYYD